MCGKWAQITSRMLCASNPGKDSCQGDSGGEDYHEKQRQTSKTRQIWMVVIIDTGTLLMVMKLGADWNIVIKVPLWLRLAAFTLWLGSFLGARAVLRFLDKKLTKSRFFQSNAPGVYARVTSQLSWVKSRITGTTCSAWASSKVIRNYELSENSEIESQLEPKIKLSRIQVSIKENWKLRVSVKEFLYLTG